MEQWMLFLQERWFIILIAVVVLYLVIKLVKTVIKWLVVLLIIAAVIYYGMNYKDQISELAGTIGSNISETVKEQAMKAMAAEAKEAKYKLNSDGSYTVTTKNIQVDVAKGSDEARITFLGQSFNIKINEVLQSFIDQAKSQ
ncbi:hypothetical protein [Paenibacillus sp. J2TS4]|uniref:hypothetical protein n=1 Tax=Paenibacillus sp. J2TS4 TaxID=2807194 RepID=UPI001B08D113|nr:hypothetical protein [Paenibacillus sp. J2TS4]GIP31154.1 hypothetical protein J2TS4_03640 [Paenibacillus sp. J2TS4]